MKYIIDCDPGIDDTIALLLAIKNKLDIIGITVVSGNVNIDKSINNVMITEEFLNCNIPIYKGTKNNDNSFISAEFAHGYDGLGYAVYPKCKSRKIERMAAENFIISSSKKYKDNLTIICLGPLSNIGKAIKKCPNLHKYLKHIVVMGFSYIPEKTSKYVEFNINKDLHSAKLLLKTPFEDIKIITHEIGSMLAIEKDYIRNLHKSKDITSRFISSIAEKYINFCKEKHNINGIAAPDPITVASVIKPNLINYDFVNIDIQLNEDNRGICLINKVDKSNIKIANSINMEAFNSLFKKTFK